ncbi:MAG: alpha-ketoacid dehydrogenase subunit beta [Kiritimatiellia bacterium]|nr:alpha-ketoacid dehydrogenase subunit beta [Kiritimatiellia bacterium]
MREITYIQAVNEALREEMERDPNVFIIGEDVGDLGGGFGATKGLLAQFGPKRVRQSPISESGFTGLGVGAAMVGLRPVVEIMYIDFIATAMDQVVNQAAKMFFMSGNQISVPMVIRAPYGVGSREAAQHSQSPEAWFVNTPGLKVVMPSTAYDAKGLLKTSIRGDSPVFFIENRMLYFSPEKVPEGEWLIPLGQAAVKREGKDITLVALSGMVPKAILAAESLGKEISVEVIDPRTLVPLDINAIINSLKKTGKLLVVHDAPVRNGFGAEIVRRVAAEAFDYLDAAPEVLGGLNTPIPFSPPLEDVCIPQVADIVAKIKEMTR